MGLNFKLDGDTFEDLDPEIRFSSFNKMAFVERINRERPDEVVVHFDGSPSGMMLMMTLASEVGYYANVEGTKAVFERV